MLPIVIIAILGAVALARALGTAPATPATSVGQELSSLQSPQLAHPTATSGGLQALGAEEKLYLFRQLKSRVLIDRGRVGADDVMVFKDLRSVRPNEKTAPALDVVYGANMGLGLPSRLAILVGKVGTGETAVLASTDWVDRVYPGSQWNIFLAPGEAEMMAKAAGVDVLKRPALPTASTSSDAAAAAPAAQAILAPAAGAVLTPAAGAVLTPAAGATAASASLTIAKTPVTTSAASAGYVAASRAMTTAKADVITIPVDSSAELGSLLPASIGFVSDEAEDRATTPALQLPNALAALRDTYQKANALYVQNEIERAKQFAPVLSPTVEPLRTAGYALASSQIQTLLAKVGA